MAGGKELCVGAVNYLNTKPLVFGLDRCAPEARLVFDLPSRLADGLAAGTLDVALIPSIELFQHPEYRVVCDACIACRGPVLSVKLFGRVPLEQVRTLALDEGSRTSGVLAQILLAERFGIAPRIEKLPIGASLADSQADAVLLIGDRAIHSPGGRFADVWDLGDQWCQWSGLPMVFALWTARRGTDLGELPAALEQARDQGVAHLAEIAALEAPGLGLTRPECLAYLRDNLHFYAGDAERRGLKLFYQQAAALGLVPAGFDLEACLQGVLCGQTANRPASPNAVPQSN